MLDHEQRSLLADLVDQCDRAFGLRTAHAGGRLIEQQDVGVSGDGESDLQRALFGIGEQPGRHAPPVEKIDFCEYFLGALLRVGEPLYIAPERIAVAHRP